MSMRHYLAKLISSSDLTATCRFTPDSITQKYWGTVEFNLETCEYRIVELAPDPEDWGWPQETVCVCLAKKLKKHIDISGMTAPSALEWVS